MKKIHYFNPGHEAAVLNGSPYYMAPANVVKMQQDLSFLPAWYANADDYILIEAPLPSKFINDLSNNLLNISKSIISPLLSTIPSKLLAFPWGLSPQSIYFFEEIRNQFNIECQIPRWNNRISDLISRSYAKETLEILCSSFLEFERRIIPRKYDQLTSIEYLVAKEKKPLLAKSPFSSSGRGLLWLPEILTRTERQILHGIIKKQGYVYVEEALNKKLDFAMEFFINEENIIFEGYSLFQTNSKGAYSGNYLGQQDTILRTISSYIDIEILEIVKEKLIEIFKKSFLKIYHGYIGVDMMVYEDYDGENRLHPCVEINVRCNMGVIAIMISKKHLHSESEGSFVIDYMPREGLAQETDEEMKGKFPAIFQDKKIKSGYLSLCPISEKTKYRAYILIKEKD